MTMNVPTPATPEKFTRQHGFLILLLAGVVMIEGFDIAAASVVLPYLGKEFGAPPAALGNALAIIGAGSIAAWLLIRLADRFGRRPILLLAATGFSLGSLATAAFAHSVPGYAFLQFATRALLVTQIAMAYLILSETLPPKLRGRANGLMGAMGSFGAALPFVVIGHAVESPLGWRMIFIIGAAPLLIMPVLWWKLRETPVWRASRDNGGATHSQPLAELRRLIQPDLRMSFIAMSALWLIINFASAVSSLFFTLYVVNERGWPPGDFAKLAPFGLAGAFAGNVIAGQIADLIGRRWALSLFLGLLGVFTITCYTSSDWLVIAGSFVVSQALLGIWNVAYTMNSELFPTDMRAAANGWCHNLIGRWGMVAAPWMLGEFTHSLGSISAAASLLGVAVWLAIPIIVFVLPETRGRRLDQRA
jgi:MFS family permease